MASRRVRGCRLSRFYVIDLWRIDVFAPHRIANVAACFQPLQSVDKGQACMICPFGFPSLLQQ